MKFETQLIHAGISHDEFTGAVNVPIYQSSTFRQSALGVHQGYEYSRTGNPTRTALEALIRDLEQGDAGFAFASGMAALSTVLALFKQGDRILISDNLYGGSYRVLEKVFKKFGINYTMVDTTALDKVRTALDKESFQAVLIETPTNPLLGISDIEAIAELTHQHQALLIVDNTFMTPYLQKPLLLGADIVVHSATKYLGGHSDLIAGLVVTKQPELSQELAFHQNAIGAVLGPQDAFLLIRGIRTLALRMDRHLENSRAIVAYLKSHPKISKVYHPSLTDHPNHDIAYRQSEGGVPIISFVLDDSIDLNAFLSSLKLIILAESLGGVESLISHPASMTHASYPESYRNEIGIVPQLVRLSVGIEHASDLIQDLKKALQDGELE